MGSRSDLLDELARVYARVAVEEFLAGTVDGVAEDDGDTRRDENSATEPPAIPEGPK